MSENFDCMTFAEGLSFIGRTRRQLDRFDHALPHAEGESIDPQAAAAIRRLCNELEAHIRKSLSGI
jgi:hypothetical protein